MVADKMAYLFIGEDSLSKEAQFKKIKEQFLAKGLEQFNLDILYAGDIPLKGLQERFLCLPSSGSKRVIVIKQIEELTEEAKEFISGYLKKPNPQIVLVLDACRQDRRDSFLNSLTGLARVFRFKEEPSVDTFALNRQIGLGRPDVALRVLNQLLKNGERPERILGGLRYAWERDARPALAMQKRLKLLVNCDLEIKTGRLKPPFALEKLVICLCGLLKPAG
ncbi:MAG: hypothetical protein V1925_03395 [Candidatus Omnitrophota bacterium]